jgi:thymidylate synthase (FAD)
MTDITLGNTFSVELSDWMGDDQAICRAARVSTLGTGAFDTDESAGLINFLMKNRHGTPFEQNAMTFRVTEIIATSREFKRHRIGFSFNEESGRYKTLESFFYIPPRDRPLVQVGKAGAYDIVPGTEEQHLFMAEKLAEVYQLAWKNYMAMIEAGIAKEVARFCLPVGIYTTSYVTCNARSLMSFLSLRTKELTSTFPSYPMYEIEVIARQMEALFAQLFPVTYAAWNANGRVSP